MALQSNADLRLLNPLNTKLNPICHLLALLAHPILHVSRIRVKGLLPVSTFFYLSFQFVILHLLIFVCILFHHLLFECPFSWLPWGLLLNTWLTFLDLISEIQKKRHEIQPVIVLSTIREKYYSEIHCITDNTPHS